MVLAAKKQDGFVLVTTVWILSIMMLAVGAFALWVDSGLAIALDRAKREQGLIDIHSTQATLLYLMATQGFSQAGIMLPQRGPGSVSNPGLEAFIGGAAAFGDMGERVISIQGNEIFVDATPYGGVGSARFSVMDVSGMVPLNVKSPVYTKAFLEVIGMSEGKSSALVDSLLDYIDADDLHRANGKERFHYQRKKRIGPANSSLLSRFELKDVYGWDALDVFSMVPELGASLHAGVSNKINVNAISKTSAKALLGLNEQQVQKLISERAVGRFENINDLVKRAGIPLSENFQWLSVLPSNKFRITYWYDGAGLKREIVIELAPLSAAGSPWLVSRDLLLPIQELDSFVESNKPQTQLFH